MPPPRWPTSTARREDGQPPVTAAAIAAERFGATAHQIHRVEAPHQIRRHADHQARLAVAGDPDDCDHAGADLLLAVVREALQILDLDAGHHAGDELDIAHLA